MTIAALVLLTLAAFVVAVRMARRSQADAAQLEEAGERIRTLEREAAQLKREAQQLRDEHQFAAHFIHEFPHLTRELHSGVNMRRIPSILLNIAVRTLQPQQALVLVRRRRAESDEGRGARLVVAAVEPPGSSFKPGLELSIGEGELGFAAEVQRVMSRQDFDSLTSLTRQRLQHAGLPDFSVDLVAPMVFDGETLGLIAVSRPRQTSGDAKAVLRVVAQIGALAVHNAAAYTEMKVTADLDGLTKVYNKRQMTQILAEQVFEAQQRASPVSIFMFDIDHFKNYNDLNGHVAGDKLLARLAALVKENIRKDDVFGRFGGEEFLLILPHTRAAQAAGVAEKVRLMIASCSFAFGERQPLGFLSISGGVAECPAHASDSTRLLAEADRALYAAKRQGRNRVLTVATQYLSAGEADSVEDRDFLGGEDGGAD